MCHAQTRRCQDTGTFLRGRTDGALVLVSAEPRTGQSEEQWKAQEEFAGVVFPLCESISHERDHPTHHSRSDFP